MEKQQPLDELLEALRANQTNQTIRSLRNYICATCSKLRDCIQCYCCKSYSCSLHVVSETYAICDLCTRDMRKQNQQIPDNVCWACYAGCTYQPHKIRMLIDNDEIMECEAAAYRNVSKCRDCSIVVCEAHTPLNRGCTICRQIAPKNDIHFQIDAVFSRSAGIARIPPRALFWDEYEYETKCFTTELTDTFALGYVAFYCNDDVMAIVHGYIGDVQNIWRCNAQNIPDSLISYRAGVPLHLMTNADRYAFEWMVRNKTADYPFPKRAPAETYK